MCYAWMYIGRMKRKVVWRVRTLRFRLTSWVTVMSSRLHYISYFNDKITYYWTFTFSLSSRCHDITHLQLRTQTGLMTNRCHRPSPAVSHSWGQVSVLKRPAQTRLVNYSNYSLLLRQNYHKCRIKNIKTHTNFTKQEENFKT